MEEAVVIAIHGDDANDDIHRMKEPINFVVVAVVVKR